SPVEMSLSNKSLIATQPHPDSLADFSIPEPQSLPGQRYRLGDMLWAKVGSHPYWPCMVYFGPESNTICKPHSKAGTRYAYHVQFFGPLVERAWVPDNANLLPFHGKAAFDEYVEEQGWRTKAARAQFEVRPRIQPVWEASWREAEEALKLPHLERMYRFGRVYYDDSTSKTSNSGTPSENLAKKDAHSDKRAGRTRVVKEDSDSDWSESSHRQQQQCRAATSSSKKKHWTAAVVKPSAPVQRTSAVSQQEVRAQADSQEAPNSIDSDSDSSSSSSSRADDGSQKFSTTGSAIRFQFQRLKPPPPLGPSAKRRLLDSLQLAVCGRCEEPSNPAGPPGTLAACQGVCARLFHQDCLLRRQPKLLCDNCCRPDQPGGLCGLCDRPVAMATVAMGPDRRAVCQTCSRVYHGGCLDDLLDAARAAGLSSGASHRLLARWEADSLIACPRHACRSCVLDGCSAGQAAVGVQVSCVRCPAAYHSSPRCVPAGSHFLTPACIICPDHLLSDSSKRRSSCSATATRHVNTSWCFACLRSGGLSGCQRCPASYHIACLPDSPSAAPAAAPFTCTPAGSAGSLDAATSSG
ncbi:hypothetical protein BOX15_Mlig028383g3, partial [Macrostomum lignano]